MKRNIRPLVTLLFVFSFTCAYAQVYTITDLGILPTGSSSQANALNDFGQVTGTANVTTNHGLRSRAFVWTWKNGLQDLGTLPGDDGLFSSWGTGINDLGQVVGGSWQDDQSNNTFLWTRDTGMQNLEGDRSLAAYTATINDFGRVASTVSNTPEASTWTRSGGWQPLNQSQVYASWAYGINLPGDVVGQAWTAQGRHATLWSNGAIQDLGTLPGGDGSVASAINAVGQIVGSSNGAAFPVNTRAFLRQSNGSMVDLGTLPGGTDSGGNAINLFGAVVGWSNSQSSPQLSHAFLWTNRTGMWDLNSLIPSGSGWVLTSAASINGWGQIAGTGTINGVSHAFLLTPSRSVNIANH